MALEIAETPGRPYRINLPTFEGPLDLLLYLIRKNELDIWDIPITQITDEYLAHLELLQELNLDLAGEFLLMAAMLTTLKSRMLLPSESGGSGPEIEDPRTELVERLLEYQRYREVANALAKGAVLNRDVFERGQSAVNLPEGTPHVLPEVSLFDLLSALQDVLGRAQARGHIHHITPERFSVVDRIHWLHDRVRTGSRLRFRALFREAQTRMEQVLTFLALLEMVKANILMLVLDVGTESGGEEGAELTSSRAVEAETALETGVIVPRKTRSKKTLSEGEAAVEVVLVNDLDWLVVERDPGAQLLMDWRGIE